MRKILVIVLVLVLVSYFYCSSNILASSIVFKDMPLKYALESLVKRCKMNIILPADNQNLEQQITLKLNNISSKKALKMLLTNYKLPHKLENNLLIIYPKTEINMEDRYSPEIISLQNTLADDIVILLRKIYPKNNIVEESSCNAIVVKADEEIVNKIKKTIADLDKPALQVMIKSEIVEIAKSSIKELGIDWDILKKGISIKYDRSKKKFSSDTQDIVGKIKCLLAEGKARLVASPQIKTQDKKQATINIGDRIPYALPVTSTAKDSWTISYIDAGIILKITPYIYSKNNIFLDINSELSSLREWRNTAAGDFPVISSRSAKTQLRIKNNDMVVIAGLKNKTKRVRERKVPILGDIPILGYVLKSQEVEEGENEILFLINIEVLD